MKKRILSILLVAAMLLSIIPATFARESGFAPGDSGSTGTGGVQLPVDDIPKNNSGFATGEGEEKIVYDASGRFSLKVREPEADETVEMIVVMKQQPLLKAGFKADEIAARSAKVVRYENSQLRGLSALEENLTARFAKEEGFKLGFTYTISMTGMSVTTAYGNKAAIEAMPGVDYVYVAPMFSLPEDLSPMTANATTMIGADIVNATGYTGKGMKVAILDTGISLGHPSFGALSEDKLTDSSLTAEKVATLWNTLNASKTSLRNQAYYSTKIPFIFNYNGMDFDVSHNTAGHDHGTHCAGIAAANRIASSEVVGVAPDAQIVVMQVFSRSGASWATIMAGLEDCVRLDVDACNLSLGSAAGYTTGNMSEVLALFEKTDIQVVIAGGNDTNNAYQNLTGTNLSKTGNPDNGLVGTPSTLLAALSIASVDNDGAQMLYFTVGEKKIGFNDTAQTAATRFISNFASRTLEFVFVDGFGTAGDFEKVNVSGKVAVVSRGGNSFPEKQANAQAAGAIACVVYNNASGMINMQINDGEGNIPAIFISQSFGLYLKEQYEAGVRSLTVCDGTPTLIKLDRTVSDFSSWGVTPDLKLKPELAGVGGNIYSTRDPSVSGSNYGYMSGTSMATPQITGAMAVLVEYLRETYPEFKEAELRRLAANLMMSTANPVMAALNLEVSPRGQGAGLADLTRATQTLAYLSNPDAYEFRPKGEFGDDDEKTGVYEFRFTIHNLSATENLTYTFDASVLSESVSVIGGVKYIAGKPYRLNAKVEILGGGSDEMLAYDFNHDGEITTADARVLLLHVTGESVIGQDDCHYAYLDVNGDGEINEADVDVILDFCAELEVSVDLMKKIEATEAAAVESVEVKVGQSVTLTARITLSDDDKQYLNENFENGIYIEGFLYANTDKEGSRLNMPFVGFYGDWSDAPIFDSADESEASLYPRRIYTANAQIGTNPYIRTGAFGDQYNAFSYANPLAEIDVGLLRNAKQIRFTVTDAKTGEVYWTLSGTDIAKSYYNSSYGMIFPFYVLNGEGEVWDGMDAEDNKLPDGTEVIYTTEAWLDDGDDIVDDSFSFHIRLDDKAPELVNAATLQQDLMVRISDNSLILPLKIRDNQHVAAVIFTNKQGVIMGKYEIPNTPGEIYNAEFDITGFGVDFTITICDYACNETEIEVSLDLGDLDVSDPTVRTLEKGRLYGCETFDGALVEGGWFSANKADFSDPRNETYDSTNRYYSAEFVNGRLIAQRASDGALVLVTPYSSYWGTTVLLKQHGKVGDSGVWVLYDMALDYSSKGAAESDTRKNSLYAVGWLYQGDNDGDGKDDGANSLFKISFYDNGYVSVDRIAEISGTDGELLTLGCTTEGQLYGISTAGKFYSVERDGTATYIGTTEFVNYENYSGANVIQSMGYDHNTDTMYWYAHSQTAAGGRYINVNVTYTVDLETGHCTEVGTYGPGGQTCLFVPNELESDLFVYGVKPERFQASEWQMNLAIGQRKRVEVKWEPWNAAQTKLTWRSEDESIATVSASGFVTAKSTGTTYIEATGQVWNQWKWNPETSQNEPGWEDHTTKVKVTVLPSADAIYSYVIADFKNADNNFRWVTFKDITPGSLTQIAKQKLPATDREGNPVMIDALWQGGAYYNGYVYTVTMESGVVDNVIYAGTALYRFRVNKGKTPDQTTFGEPERVGFTENVELGNLGFDYNTGRMYAVDYTHGGLAIVDLDTGAADLLGTYSGDIGGPVITPAMCVTAEGLIVVSDMSGQLYTVDPDTLATYRIDGGSLGQDTWYYAAMTYDYNTGNIYWNPCMNAKRSPLCLVRIQPTEWDPNRLEAVIVDLGDISTSSGVETTVLFTIPENEPETRQIPVESIDITNGETAVGLVGGTLKLNTVTNPLRPTVQTKTWTTSNPDVVTVDRFGTMTFTGVGTATVTVSITNKDEATYGGPFTDSIEVTVYASAGNMIGFLNGDDYGSQYYDFWLTVPDNDLTHSPVTVSAINSYSLRTGVYYDGYIYAYLNSGKFHRFDANNVANYVDLGTVNLDTETDQITGMAVDYASGKVYAVTLSGKFGTVNLDNGQFTEIGTPDAKISVLAVDKRGVVYAAGSQVFGEEAKLYTVNPANAECTFVKDIPGAHVGTGANYYGSKMYNAQMTYDFKTDRIYLHATYHTKDLPYCSGMYMMLLGNETPEILSLGKVAIQTAPGRDTKIGKAYLGLLATTPDMADVPVGEVNGLLLNKTVGRIQKGSELQLSATVRPSNAVNKDVTWSSSNPEIAAVDANGRVLGVSEGVVTITVRSEQTGVTASCTVTVVDLTGKPASKAFTVSGKRDALISFNPELPGATAEVVASFSGGTTIAGMAYDGENGIWYVANEGGLPSLYYYDMTTGQSAYKGTLYTYSDASDLAYDPVERALYVVSNYYIFQFLVDKLESFSYSSASIDVSNLGGMPQARTVTVKDGYAYFLGRGYNGTVLYRVNQEMRANEVEIVASDIDLVVENRVNEMVWDETNGCFYVTDSSDLIYKLVVDETAGTHTLTKIDTVGDGIDINGLTIIPAKAD